ncbi:MAG: E3 binding domain-containing protein, partial [Desulfobacteraceae bacterium]|nr:E3 binding domain-containing protein [Desulfobacteraceae bacterium]
MSRDVKVPSVGESVTEALLVQWLKNDGDQVKTDEPLFVIETDKVTLEVTADTDGELKIKVKEGETVSIGTVVAVIETSSETHKTEPEKKKISENTETGKPAEKPQDAATPEDNIAPSVRRLAKENQINLSDITASGPGGRITKGDVLLFLEASGDRTDEPDTPAPKKADPDTPAPAKATPDKAETDKADSDKAESGKTGPDES